MAVREIVPVLRRQDVDHVMERIDQMLDQAHGADDVVMLKLDQVAALLDVSIPTVKRRIGDGSLRATRLRGGRSLRVSLRDLRRYLRT